jgi:phage shock protein A
MDFDFINYYAKYIVLDKKYKKLMKETNILKEGNDEKIYNYFLEENEELKEKIEELQASIFELKFMNKQLQDNINDLEKYINGEKIYYLN